MLTWEEKSDETKTALQNGSQNSARPDLSPEQLSLDFAGAPEIDLDSPPRIDEAPTIRRIVMLDETDYIRRIIEVTSEPAQYWRWEKFLRTVIGHLPSEVDRIWNDTPDPIAKTVAVHVAPDQPPQHKQLNYCPTYCPAFRFGPKAREPPASVPTSLGTM